jgi:hypothetical protein
MLKFLLVSAADRNQLKNMVGEAKLGASEC